MTPGVGHIGDRSMRRAAGIFLILVAMFGTGVCEGAQAPKDGAPSAFDTVSIKVNKSGSLNSNFSMPVNGLSMTNTPVKHLIAIAFSPLSLKYIFGLPGWADSVRFDIQARIDDEKIADLKKLSAAEAMKERQEMMRQILFDRFNLKMHREDKRFPAYTLVLAKGGPKFKEADPNLLKNPTSEYHPGLIAFRGDELIGQAVSIRAFAVSISGLVGREIIDQTGLTGRYDVSLKLPSNRDSQDQPDTDPVSAGASVIAAIQEQLGLRLESAHEQLLVNTMVVDSIEMPTEN